MIEARGAAIAAAAVRRVQVRVAEAARALLPGAVVTIEEQGVGIEGRGLAARRDADPALRWLGGEVR